MNLSNLEHIASRRIAEILMEHSGLEKRVALLPVLRIDYVGSGKPEKMLDLLAGSLSDYDYVGDQALAAEGEMAMYYANGDVDVAYEMVRASPIGDRYTSEEKLKKVIADHWRDMGASKFSDHFNRLG